MESNTQKGAQTNPANYGQCRPGPRGGGPEARCRGQVVVDRAGVLCKPKDGALGDCNEEQNVKEGLRGKNVVTEKKEVIGGEEETRPSETLKRRSRKQVL